MHPSIRLLPFALTDGPHNMAADELMLEQAASQGVASFRLYGWVPATLSLGYFQRQADRLGDATLAAMPWVRRSTGGGAIVHKGDLTYALAVPEVLRRPHSPSAWHDHVHAALARALQAQAVPAEVMSGRRRPPDELDFLCFVVPQPGDVILNGAKIVGSAQRLRRGAILQHGSIQHAGLNADLLAQTILAELGFAPRPSALSEAERRRLEEIVRTRYATRGWNERR